MAYVPQTILSKTLQRVKAQLLGVSSGSSPALTITRVFVGWNARNPTDSTPNNLSLYNDVATNGPLAGISLPTGTIDNVQAKTGMMYSTVQIWIKKDLNVSWDGSDIADLMKNCLDAILDSPDYLAGEIVPRLAGIANYAYDTTDTPGLHQTTLMFSFFDPEVETPDPVRINSWLGARKNRPDRNGF